MGVERTGALAFTKSLREIDIDGRADLDVMLMEMGRRASLTSGVIARINCTFPLRGSFCEFHCSGCQISVRLTLNMVAATS